MEFFRSTSYLDFARYLNELGGIYYHRYASLHMDVCLSIDFLSNG